ncbi:MAG: hypothetical protein WDM78_10225 [Puia sp.]
MVEPAGSTNRGVINEAICANCYGMGTFPTTLNVWAPKNGAGANGMQSRRP